MNSTILGDDPKMRLFTVHSPTPRTNSWSEEDGTLGGTTATKVGRRSQAKKRRTKQCDHKQRANRRCWCPVKVQAGQPIISGEEGGRKGEKIVPGYKKLTKRRTTTREQPVLRQQQGRESTWTKDPVRKESRGQCLKREEHTPRYICVREKLETRV